jgi:hypothetical protein
MNDLDDRLAAWNPVQAEDMLHATSSADAARLLHRILDQPVTSPPQRRTHRPGWQARAWIATAAAAAVIAAIAVTLPSPSGSAGRDVPGFQRGPSVGLATNAAELVDYATRSAASTQAFVPGPRDWTYFEILYGRSISGGPDGEGIGQTWQQVGTSRFAASWQHGKLTYGTGGSPGASLNGWPGPNSTTMYRYLASLPAQPAALRKIIMANNNGDPGAAFTAIENLFGNFQITARLQAELYAVLVTLPGVQFTRNAVDAAGRPGIGLYLVQDNQVNEIIVNPRTYVYMGTLLIATQGHSSYATMLAHPSRSATLESAAILNSGIVNQPGQVPTST